jgi:AhpD family alkylhydroperoxidase
MAHPTTMRIHSATTYYRVLDALVRAGIGALIRPRSIGKQTTERLMLAVTQVNGCRYCSYLHTRLALRAGVEAEETRALMAGDLEAAPPSEHTALIFAQHMADAEGQPDAEAFDRVLAEYGPEATHEITTSIRAILVGNLYGIAFDSLLFRLRLRPVAGSSLWRELAILVGSAIWGPVVVVRALVGRLLRQRRSPREEVLALDGPRSR